MFHVLTVHWQDDKWIEPQLRYLERNLPEFRVYASLDGIDASWRDRFFYATTLEGNHPEKLNALAQVACAAAGPDDLLLFLDGDAFPIAPVTPAVLDGTQLVAVRRDENLGQKQPHPCFCITPARFWTEIEGDWRPGYTWTASNGETTTDSGGNLLGILNERAIPWRPLVRTNRFDLDPLWFGVYGDLVYHHGAGFRPPLSFRVESPSRRSVRAAVASARTPSWVPGLGRVERSIRYRLAMRREARRMEEYRRRSEVLSDEVFGWIATDDAFYQRFLEPASGHGANAER